MHADLVKVVEVEGEVVNAFIVIRKAQSVTNHENDGVVDVDLMMVVACVLPICATCKCKGSRIVVGRYLPNGKALLKRLDNSRRVGFTTPSGPWADE